MTHWLQDTVRTQLGEALMTSGVERMLQSWQAPAERWQRMVRQMQSTVNLPEILRARIIL